MKRHEKDNNYANQNSSKSYYTKINTYFYKILNKSF